MNAILKHLQGEVKTLRVLLNNAQIHRVVTYFDSLGYDLWDFPMSGDAAASDANDILIWAKDAWRENETRPFPAVKTCYSKVQPSGIWGWNTQEYERLRGREAVIEFTDGSSMTLVVE